MVRTIKGIGIGHFIFILAFLVFLALLSLSKVAQAAGKSGHAPQVSDLLWPAINFSILIFIFVILLRKKISNFFDENAKNVEKLYHYAADKNQQVQLRLNNFQNKLKNIENEKRRILLEVEKEEAKFEKQVNQENFEKIQRLERDALHQIEHEKNMAVKKINSLLVEEVVNKTKDKIKLDEKSKQVISDNFFAGI